MGKLIDLSNQKFRHWQVLYKDNSTVRDCAYWICRCDCGNIKSVSSSDLRKGTSSTCLQCGINRKIGTKINRLTILEIDKNPPFDPLKNHCTALKCKCDCGKILTVRSNLLFSGHTTSCGCYNKFIVSEKKSLNLKNKRFGKLVALYRDKSINNRTFWICKCDCGNIKSISTDNLLRNTKSCGCLVSKGEYLITNILQQNKINYKNQYSFVDLVSDKGAKLKFDFGILKNNKLIYCIEYDGIQHFESRNDNGWNNKTNLLKTQYHDNLKNNYCQSNNIPLIRIPYWHKNITIIDLIPKTSTFVIRRI